MRSQLSLRRRFQMTVGLALGAGWTAWRYMWRTTPTHRTTALGSWAEHAPPPLPDDLASARRQPVEAGVGSLFHRRYRIEVRHPPERAGRAMRRLQAHPDRMAPSELARFVKVAGGPSDDMARGDEYVVRMPGPWDGPVRVASIDERHFRLATLVGHLEAGQIEFRTSGDDPLVIEIESWARSGDRLSQLLYERLGISREVQFHMWCSFLEGAARASGGRLVNGVTVDTVIVPDDELPF